MAQIHVKWLSYGSVDLSTNSPMDSRSNHMDSMLFRNFNGSVPWKCICYAYCALNHPDKQGYRRVRTYDTLISLHHLDHVFCSRTTEKTLAILLSCSTSTGHDCVWLIQPNTMMFLTSRYIRT